MDELPVSARGLVKRYGDVVALAGVDLTVERGDVYGFLGPNGAGKTTALRILLGLIRPSAGEARLFGRDPQRELPRALDGVGGFVETPAPRLGRVPQLRAKPARAARGDGRRAHTRGA